MKHNEQNHEEHQDDIEIPSEITDRECPTYSKWKKLSKLILMISWLILKKYCKALEH